MIYNFDINDLEIINHLVYDASLNYNELKLLNGGMTLTIERRALEDVHREKWMLWHKSIWKGKKSQLQFYGILSMKLLNADEKHKDNHFIDGIINDPIMSVV